MELSGRRERGRLQRRFMVVVKEDMQTLMEEEATATMRWRQMTCCGIFSRERLKENEKDGQKWMEFR